MFVLRALFVAARPPDPIAFMPYSTMVLIRLSSRVDKFLVRPSVVTSLSCADRGHHVPALTVTSGERGVGSDVACSGTPGGSRPPYAGNSSCIPRSLIPCGDG